jgi:hypothetical protein
MYYVVVGTTNSGFMLNRCLNVTARASFHDTLSWVRKAIRRFSGCGGPDVANAVCERIPEDEDTRRGMEAAVLGCSHVKSSPRI